MARHRRSAKINPAQLDFAAALTAGGANAVRETPAAFAAGSYFAEFVPVYAVKLVRTGSLASREQAKVTSPRDVVNLLFKHFTGADREQFVAVLLDTKNQVIGVTTISVGDLSTALVHPREVFKPAILANVATIILAHNHPSGDPSPSPDDVAVTRRLAEAGEMLGIDVLDHIVLGNVAETANATTGRWVSMTEKGLHVCGSSRASAIYEGGNNSFSPSP